MTARDLRGALNEFHVDEVLRNERDPALRDERRRWDAQAAAELATEVECKTCGASAGQPCEGLVTAVHYERQLTYVTRGLPRRKETA